MTMLLLSRPVIGLQLSRETREILCESLGLRYFISVRVRIAVRV